jgi:hypothetical protein
MRKSLLFTKILAPLAQPHLTTFIAIGIVIIFSYVLSRLTLLGFWQSYLSNALATMAGILVGVPITLWVTSRQESAAAIEKRTKIFESLGEELKGNNDLIYDWLNSGKDNWKLTTIGVKMGDEIWNAFSDGGELQWIKEPWPLRDLANAYGDIKRIKYLSDKYLNFNSMDSSTVKVIETDLTAAIDSAQHTIDEAILLVKHYSRLKPLREYHTKKDAKAKK